MWCFDEKIDAKINGTQSSEMDQYKHRHLIFNESIIHREIMVVFTIHVTHAKKKKKVNLNLNFTLHINTPSEWWV